LVFTDSLLDVQHKKGLVRR